MFGIFFATVPLCFSLRLRLFPFGLQLALRFFSASMARWRLTLHQSHAAMWWFVLYWYVLIRCIWNSIRLMKNTRNQNKDEDVNNKSFLSFCSSARFGLVHLFAQNRCVWFKHDWSLDQAMLLWRQTGIMWSHLRPHNNFQHTSIKYCYIPDIVSIIPKKCKMFTI